MSGITVIDFVIEFGIVAFIAYLISFAIYNSVTSVNIPPQQAVGWQWLSFFAILLIYYRLIRVQVNIRKSLR